MPEKDLVTVDVGGRRMRLSSLDKLLYPATETTKGEVLNYYAQIAPVLMPVIEGRPVTRIRWPHGVGDMMFFEKNMPSGAPSWIERVTITGHGSRGGGDVVYPLVSDLAALTYLVNLNSLELHVPQWRVSDDGEPEHPDRLVIDLDPGSPAGLHECAQVALVVRETLAAEGYSSVPVTSGSKGMQLYAALDGSQSSDEVREWTKGIAQRLTKEMPGQVVWKMTKSLRPGKVLLDWSQNVAAKTTIAPYSLRGKERPTVAAPRTWDEVEQGADDRDALQQLDIDDVLERVDEYGDLFGDRLTPPE
ncbi:non-homologous end-joining DNA ligase [Luteipulveratus halotolerans]|uniref:ATP-dependent DNA ligase n=1 Tax=Luteipulveratus halotolerans TaxID=1631356 RepID=A0A0L6CE74_9MICO|nr:non-homologous end-joining DNA ligase [Luteipulveratus halotolerans]KNX36176.1 ATP-dependent DNA ligase [Luteipulveratus halotolerans]